MKTFIKDDIKDNEICIVEADYDLSKINDLFHSFNLYQFDGLIWLIDTDRQVYSAIHDIEDDHSHDFYQESENFSAWEDPPTNNTLNYISSGRFDVYKIIPNWKTYCFFKSISIQHFLDESVTHVLKQKKNISFFPLSLQEKLKKKVCSFDTLRFFQPKYLSGVKPLDLIEGILQHLPHHSNNN